MATCSGSHKLPESDSTSEDPRVSCSSEDETRLASHEDSLAADDDDTAPDIRARWRSTVTDCGLKLWAI